MPSITCSGFKINIIKLRHEKNGTCVLDYTPFFNSFLPFYLKFTRISCQGPIDITSALLRVRAWCRIIKNKYLLHEPVVAEFTNIYIYGSPRPNALQWRQIECDGVPNHQPHDRLPHPTTTPAQRASNAENVSIWWRHHGWRKIQWYAKQIIIRITIDSVFGITDILHKKINQITSLFWNSVFGKVNAILLLNSE